MPPPLPPAELPESVQLVIVSAPLFTMPPPLPPAVLPESVQLVIVSVAGLYMKIAPPLPPPEALALARVSELRVTVTLGFTRKIRKLELPEMVMLFVSAEAVIVRLFDIVN